MTRTTAITNWSGIVSPLFDSAAAVLIVGKDSTRRQVTLKDSSLFARAELLQKNNVEVLICGAISAVAVSLIQQKGIEVVSWIRGAVDEVVEAYNNGTLDSSQYVMPGCKGKGWGRGKRRRCRNGSQRCCENRLSQNTD